MVAGSAVAKPSSPAHEFRHFDLFGLWASNCGEAPSPDNPRVTVGNGPQGVVFEQDQFGPDYEVNRYVIVAAKRMSHRRLALDALFQQGDAEPLPQLIIMQIENRTRRTLFTGGADEPPRVKDGIAVAIGKPTPLLTKCE
jgi:hypothetical protein